MQKTNKPTDWLTPKVYHGQGEDREESDVEQVLRSVYVALRKKVTQQEQIKAHADNKGRFGKYRYYDGVIAGLNIARDMISNRLADEY